MKRTTKILINVVIIIGLFYGILLAKGYQPSIEAIERNLAKTHNIEDIITWGINDNDLMVYTDEFIIHYKTSRILNHTKLIFNWASVKDTQIIPDENYGLVFQVEEPVNLYDLRYDQFDLKFIETNAPIINFSKCNKKFVTRINNHVNAYVIRDNSNTDYLAINNMLIAEGERLDDFTKLTKVDPSGLHTEGEHNSKILKNYFDDPLNAKLEQLFPTGTEYLISNEFKLVGSVSIDNGLSSPLLMDFYKNDEIVAVRPSLYDGVNVDTKDEENTVYILHPVLAREILNFLTN